MTTTVHLRELGPGELDVLDAVFAGLSPTSRYYRFHAGTPRMTPGTRRALAAVDGRRHLAVAAFDGATPLGIARLIALGDGRGELAVEVVDDRHRRGIGTRLVRAVAALGAAAGICTVEADVLAENVAAQVVFQLVFPDLTVARDGPEIRLTSELCAAPVVRWAA